MDGGNPAEDGRDYSYSEDKPNWRSKEAPEGEFDSLDPKPREFKPRDENREQNFPRRERSDRGAFERREPRRDNEKSEFKSREFKPREFKPRDDSKPNFPRKDRSGDDSNFRREDKPTRENRFGKEERPERRKVEKIKLKPATRIEDRNEYLNPVKIISDPVFENPETEIAIPAIVPDAENTSRREPSKGNKFTEQRDSRIIRTRELRPRKAKPEESTPVKSKAMPEPKVSKPELKSEPKSEPKPKTPKGPVNYDDLED